MDVRVGNRCIDSNPMDIVEVSCADGFAHPSVLRVVGETDNALRKSAVQFADKGLVSDVESVSHIYTICNYRATGCLNEVRRCVYYFFIFPSRRRLAISPCVRRKVALAPSLLNTQERPFTAITW